MSVIHIKHSRWLIDGEWIVVGEVIKERNNLRADNERLRAALAYYADRGQYAKRECLPCSILFDCGATARDALAGEQEETKSVVKPT